MGPQLFVWLVVRFIITKDVGMGFDFMDVDVVGWIVDCMFEEFVRVVILILGTSDVVEEEVYTIEAINEYVRVGAGVGVECLSTFHEK